MNEHNVGQRKGFTRRYRPWTLIRVECYRDKKAAMKRERFLKSGRGREEAAAFVKDYLSTDIVVRHPPGAERD